MLKKIEIADFTIIKSCDIEFSPGINIFLGANATGKTHVLKLAYSIARVFEQRLRTTSTSLPGEEDGSFPEIWNEILQWKLEGVFRPDPNAGRLVNRHSNNACATVALTANEGRILFDLNSDGGIKIEQWRLRQNPSSIFLPAREVLSIYPGFAHAYENRESSFDETYYDLVRALSALPLRGPRGEAAARLYQPLSDFLGGKVHLDGDRFSLTTQADGNVEAHLVAEGHRKIATLMHLIANGSLTQDGLLFWDEPEANLNPRLTKVVADFLLRLAGEGVQIFVATHDYLLTNELSLQSEYRTDPARKAPIKFFAFDRGEDGVTVQSGATLAELDHNPIMEEFEALYDRERRLFIEPDRAT